MTRAIEVRGLRVAYNGSAVVDTVTLEVPVGGWLTIIGPNGAGKTTVLRAIAGLTRYDGTIVIDGEVVGSSSRREVAQRVALVPQNPVIPPGIAVWDYVMLGRTPHLRFFEAEGAEDVTVVTRVLERLELERFSHRRLDSLSGGELQRTVLARALTQEAPLLLLDEPTSALDVGRTQEVLELVDDLRRGGEVTVVAAMHDLTTAGQFADHLVMMARGRFVVSGGPSDVLRPELIEEHYGAKVRVVDDGSGELAVIPVRTTEVKADATTN